MFRIMTRAALGLGALVFGAGMALAAPDPMQALRGKPAGAVALDPMSALRAHVQGGEDMAGNPEFDGLPNGPGAEETYYQCVACHSTEIIKQQRITDLRWDELWTWMVEEQGMVEPDEETRQVILSYLKENFSSER